MSPIVGEGRNLDQFEVAVKTIAAEVSVVGTSSGAATTCMTIGPFECQGGTYCVDIEVPYLTIGTTNLDVELWDGATFLSTLTGHMTASQARPGTRLFARVPLGAGVHTLTVKGFVDAGTGKFGADAGTTGLAPNAVARVYPA